MNKKFLFGFLIILISFYAVPAFVQAQMARGTLCPVMPGERAKEKFFVDYQGKRIHLCCRNCVKAFKKHPEKYLHPKGDG